MDSKQLSKKLKQHREKVAKFIRRDMPVHAGRIAKDGVQENFRKSGYMNDGLQPWPPAKRINSKSKRAAANYRTLTSSRNHLFSSTAYTPSDYRVRIYNPVSYAGVHNEGFRGVVYVKPHKRKRLAAMSVKGQKRIRVGGHNVKGHGRRVIIPQRQFLGKSKETVVAIQNKSQEGILEIIK